MTPQLSIIIVSYNTRDITLQCLRALAENLDHLDAEILVIDNASTDGSAQTIREQCPQARVIESKTNRGFGAANNIGFAQAAGQYFLLLNSDAFVKPGAIRTLVEYLESHPKTAIAAPRILNPDGSLQLSCFKFPTPARAWLENTWLSSFFAGHPAIGDYRRWPHDAERSVDWAIGACLLVRRSAIEQVDNGGKFDETFFMYAEETDWQRRIRNAGHDIVFLPAAQVIHLAGASAVQSSTPQSAGNNHPIPAIHAARINPPFFNSLDIYVRKHHGLAGLIALRLAMILGCSLRLPLWIGVWLCRPRQRPLAKAKIKLLAWLVLRQTFHWKSAPPDRPSPQPAQTPEPSTLNTAPKP